MAKRSSLSGFKELRELLRQLPVAVQTRVSRNAVYAAGIVWRDAARSAAPRGKQPSTSSAQYGALRINVNIYRWRRLRRKGLSGASISTNDAFWGYFQEYGTGPYYSGPGTRSKGAGARTKLKPKPWFRPALDATADRALEAMRGRMARGIATEADRLAARYRTR
ncbi:HK97-gp10 family putative phage morphogenesis protein [Dongia sp.]|uniref:HK97-gp10 family putative phage morphogenesis protein n=1 Tax=Dongia sp. TaxID=1977262 RepID=UPI0035B327AD